MSKKGLLRRVSSHNSLLKSDNSKKVLNFLNECIKQRQKLIDILSKQKHEKSLSQKKESKKSINKSIEITPLPTQENMVIRVDSPAIKKQIDSKISRTSFLRSSDAYLSSGSFLEPRARPSLKSKIGDYKKRRRIGGMVLQMINSRGSVIYKKVPKVVERTKTSFGSLKHNKSENIWNKDRPSDHKYHKKVVRSKIILPNSRFINNIFNGDRNNIKKSKPSTPVFSSPAIKRNKVFSKSIFFQKELTNMTKQPEGKKNGSKPFKRLHTYLNNQSSNQKFRSNPVNLLSNLNNSSSHVRRKVENKLIVKDTILKKVNKSFGNFGLYKKTSTDIGCKSLKGSQNQNSGSGSGRSGSEGRINKTNFLQVMTLSGKNQSNNYNKRDSKFSIISSIDLG